MDSNTKCLLFVTISVTQAYSMIFIPSASPPRTDCEKKCFVTETWNPCSPRILTSPQLMSVWAVKSQTTLQHLLLYLRYLSGQAFVSAIILCSFFLPLVLKRRHTWNKDTDSFLIALMLTAEFSVANIQPPVSVSFLFISVFWLVCLFYQLSSFSVLCPEWQAMDSVLYGLSLFFFFYKAQTHTHIYPTTWSPNWRKFVVSYVVSAGCCCHTFHGFVLRSITVTFTPFWPR